MNVLQTSVDELVASYSTQGLINHAGGPNLPSRESIRDILKDLDALLFPGFRESEVVDKANLALMTAERVHRAARNLGVEVEKSLSFLCRSTNFNCQGTGCHDLAQSITDEFFAKLPELRALLASDVDAAFRGDPAAKSVEEVIVSYPGLEAIAVHRIAHFLWQHSVPLIPRMMSEIVHGTTGIDIHPGAAIGESFFIDHGTGVVIGETCIIGREVKIYQGVTLGALSVRKNEADKKRHPTIEDGVTIYAGATILGGATTIGRGSIIGGNVWVTETVPPESVIFIKTPEQDFRRRGD